MNKMYLITAHQDSDTCVLGLFRDEYTAARSANQAKRMGKFYGFSDIRVRECPMQKDIIMKLDGVEIEKRIGEIW